MANPPQPLTSDKSKLKLRVVMTELAQTSADTLRPGFRSGFVAVFRGYKYLFSKPDLWLLALVPTIIGLFCALVLGVIAIKAVPLLVAKLVTNQGSGFLWSLVFVVLQIVVTLLALALSLALAFVLAKPLSGPALERIVRYVEADLGAPAWPAPTLLEDVSRSLQSTFVALAFTLPLFVVLSVLSFLVPPLSVITIPFQLAITALAGAWDFCDYPLSIRGVPVLERLHFMRRNWGATLGFGLGLALLSLLPCSLLIVLPAAIIGATHLVAQQERFEKTTSLVAR